MSPQRWSAQKRRLQPSNILAPPSIWAVGLNFLGMIKQIRLLNDATLLLEKGVKVLGFVQVKSSFRDLDAYYHRELGIILKRPALILEPQTPPILCVPTVKLARGWVVQPIVKKTRLKEAVERLRRQLKKYPNIYPDLHTQNVGWYKNKPLMFDW